MDCTVWVLPSLATKTELTQWIWYWWRPEKFWACLAPFPMSTHGRSRQKSWRVWKRRVSCCWKHCDQGGISGWMDCSSSWVLFYPTWRQVWRHACNLQQFPPEDWSAQPATEDGRQLPLLWPLNGCEQLLSGLKLLFHRGNKMEIGWQKLNSFFKLKKKKKETWISFQILSST